MKFQTSRDRTPRALPARNNDRPFLEIILPASVPGRLDCLEESMPDGDEALPTVAAYTDRPWVRIENETSSVSPGKWHSFKQRVRVWQSGIGRTIESRQAHLFILFLVRWLYILVINAVLFLTLISIKLDNY